MKGILAIIGDTWKQSKQQVVFIILIVLALLLTVAAIVIASPEESDNDSSAHFGTLIDGIGESELTSSYVRSYATSLVLNEKDASKEDSKPVGSFDFFSDKILAQAKAEIANQGLEPIQQAGRQYTSIYLVVLVTVLMWGFVAVCSSYFPDLLSAGAVDMVVAKPMSRTQIFFAKYFGGLAMISALLAFCQVLYFVGIGLRVGYWDFGVLLSIPATIFVAALVFAFVAAIGVLSRSTTLAMILGLIYYFVVDTILATVLTFQQMGAFRESPFWDNLITGFRDVFPNFGLLKDSATHAVLRLPYSDLSPFITGGIWLVILLGIGSWKFNRTDY